MNKTIKLALCFTSLLIMSCTKDNTEEPLSSSDVETLPVLTANPVVGQSYQFSPDGAINSDGTKAKALFRKGSNRKLIVLLNGGGASMTSYTAPRSFIAVQGTSEPGFYTANMSDSQDLVSCLNEGIGLMEEKNPFRDWTFVFLPYTTGDFHCGTGDYDYTGLDGTPKVLRHHGYTNVQLFMDAALPLLGEVDTLVVTGVSAGGIGTSVIANDIISMFPDVSNTTVCVDAGLVVYDKFEDVCKNMWASPANIRSRVVGDCFTFDGLDALHKDKPNVKILFCCSSYDETLASLLDFYATGALHGLSREILDTFHKTLGSFTEDLQRAIPEVGILIWDDVVTNQTLGATKHTIEVSKYVFDVLGGNIRQVDWLNNAVNGKVESYGLNLLNDK